MRVAELWRYPVKGLRGEALERVEIAGDGIPGDRRLRVADERGTITGRRKQRMVGLPATLDEDGEPLVAVSWSSDVAADAIRDVAGEGAGLVEAEDGHAFDLAPLLVVTDGAIAQLGYDRRRFRANILIEGVDEALEQGLDPRPAAGGRGAAVRPGGLRALRDHHHRSRHDRGRSRGPAPYPSRGRRDDGRLLHRAQPGIVAVGDPVTIVR